MKGNLKFALIVAGASFILLLSTIILTILIRPNNVTNNNSNISTSTTNNTPTYIPPPNNITPTQGKAIVQGRICNVGSPIIISAESIPDRTKVQKFYPGISIAGTDLYYFELEPGTYNFYTENNNRELATTYSQFVTCGMDQNFCISHNLVDVYLESGDIRSNIDICDSLWLTRFQNTPSPIPTTDPFALPTPIFNPLD